MENKDVRVVETFAKLQLAAEALIGMAAEMANIQLMLLPAMAMTTSTVILVTTPSWAARVTTTSAAILAIRTWPRCVMAATL